MPKNELKPGDTIPAGQIVLITSGEYSDYYVTGIFRATTDVIVPGKQNPYGKPGDLDVDTSLLSTLLEEVPHVEAWGGGW